jgi:hypothetical protein
VGDSNHAWAHGSIHQLALKVTFILKHGCTGNLQIFSSLAGT